MSEYSDFEIPSVKNMSQEERVLAQQNVAMKSPEHMLEWLEKSGRKWLVLRSDHLVKALPWPDGVEFLIQILHAYRHHRLTIPSGRTEIQKDPITNMSIEIPVMLGETLEIEELDRAIRHLITQATQKDPTWSLDNPPM